MSCRTCQLKITEHTKCLQGYEATGTFSLYTAGGSIKCYSTLKNSLKMNLP